MLERLRRIIPKKPNQFTAEWQGKEYRLRGYGSKRKFEEWFNEYVLRASCCASCEELLFPGSAVGRIGEKLVHLTFDCCPSGGFYVGNIGEDGQLDPAFGGLTSAEQAMRTGEIQFRHLE